LRKVYIGAGYELEEEQRQIGPHVSLPFSFFFFGALVASFWLLSFMVSYGCYLVFFFFFN